MVTRVKMEYIIDIDDFELECMRYLIAEPEKWIIAAIAGKVHAAGSRMKAEYVPILLADPAITSMPSTEKGVLQKILGYEGYKNRSKRDALIDINGVTIPTN